MTEFNANLNVGVPTANVQMTVPAPVVSVGVSGGAYVEPQLYPPGVAVGMTIP